LTIARYVRRNNPGQILIYTDGACLNNGLPNPTAGWAFVHGPGTDGQPLVASGRLENKGPFGEDSIQSSNRAELRAVIAVLRFRHWVGEGFSSIVFATDSEYVAEGSTTWAKSWIKRGWKTSAGQPVKNKDLWELLLGEFERWKEKGLSLEFWRIPREWNEVADEAAKIAATHDEEDQFGDVMGICI
jgi:ribonuclease HI